MSNTDNYLQHYGVLGMKWGVRRTEAQLGSNPTSGKGYQPTKKDASVFGKKGAQRIANARNNGKSYRQASSTEYGRFLLKLGTAMAGATALSYLYSSGKGSELISKGKDAVTSLYKSHYNMRVIDSAGNVIKQYRDKSYVVGDAIGNLLKGG